MSLFLSRSRARTWAIAVALVLAVPATSGAVVPDGTQPAGAEPAVVEPELRAQLDQEDVVTFWVVLDEQASLANAATVDRWDARGALVHDELVTAAEQAQSGVRDLLTERGVAFAPFWIVNAIQVTGDRALVYELAARPEVAEIVADRAYQIPEPTPAEQQETIQAVEWNIERIRASEAWSTFDARGERVVVASIDTGAQFDHPALVAQYRGARADGTFDHHYNWFDPSGVCGTPSLEPCDNVGHGTHVTGIMVGDDGDPGANQIGVAPRAQWIAAKGCEFTTCSRAALLASGQWMLAPTDLAGENPDPSRRPHIVNNSWGDGNGADPFYRTVVDAWVAAGIFPTFANGNDGPACGTVGAPASYPESYGVGSFNINNFIASSSSRGPAPESVGGSIKPNIAAPGVSVRSSVPGDSYARNSGTSMAAPHVSGTVALMWSAAPGLIGNVERSRELLDETAIDTEDLTCGGTAENNNVWGQGRLDAFAAVDHSPRGPTGTLQGTVTDTSGDPIAGATVSATGEADRSAITGPDGAYTLELPVGSYDVAVSAYGHEPAGTDVVIPEDQVVTEDFALVPLPAVTVSGTVTDASGQGWPLYARIDIDGYPLGPVFTDPSTGRYEVELVQQTDFELHVTVEAGGYVAGVRAATYQAPMATEDFALQVDAEACAAPGYRAEAAGCVPVDGGIVIGNVYSLNTGEAINDATVTSDGAPDDSATTRTTPDDPALDDGFYLLFSTLTGEQPFTVRKTGFGSTTEDVAVAADGVVRHDFQLGSGQLVVEPSPLDAELRLGTTTERTLTIRNEGTADATFELGERERGSDILDAGVAGQPGAPVTRIRGRYSPLSSAHAPLSAQADRGQTGSQPAHTGPAAPPWSDVADHPIPIMDNLADAWEGKVYSVAGTSGTGGRVHELFRYDPDADTWTELSATTIGRERPNGAIIDGKFHVVGGWNALGRPVTRLEIYDIATDTWSTGAPIPTAYAASANVVLDGELYLIGGCQTRCGFTDVWVYDPQDDEWSAAAPYPEPVGWTHCGAIDARIYCAGGVRTFPDGTTANGYVYDPAADEWSPIAPLPQDQWAGGYVAANGQLLVSGGVTAGGQLITNEGFAYAPDTDSWSPLPNANHALYRGASACGFYRIGGAVSGFNAVSDAELLPGFDGCGVTDLPWLDVTPDTATVPAGGSVDVSVSFDAGANDVDQPGDYRGSLAVNSDTPDAFLPVPVTMAATPPPSWGRLEGSVVGLGRCDTPGDPLPGAGVHITGRNTDVTVRTGPDGSFRWWLPARANPLKLTVSAPGWVGQERNRVIVVPPGRTADFTLRLDTPCAEAVPERLELAVDQGATITAPLVLANDPGAVSYPFTIDETPLALDPLPLNEGPAAADLGSRESSDSPAGASQDDPWLRGADLPVRFTRYAHTQCDGDHDTFYVFALDQAWRYSAGADEWTQLASMPNSTAPEGATAVCEAGRIHVLGGGGFTFHSVYDVARDSWRAAAEVPRRVWGAAAGAFNGKLYLVGGDTGLIGGGSDDGGTIAVSDQVNIYDIATDTWVGEGSPMPAPAVGGGVTQAGRYVYYVGSWGPQTPGPNTFTQRYDMVTDTWELGPTFEPGRADFALAATDDALYAIGGGSGFTTPNADVERLSLADWPNGSWEPIAPLPTPVWGNSGGFCTNTGAFGGEVWSVSGRPPEGGATGPTFFRDSGGESCPTIRADVPWLSLDVTNGTVPADGSLEVAVTVDATELAPGTHQATLLVTTPDPARPEIRVPVHLTVG